MINPQEVNLQSSDMVRCINKEVPFKPIGLLNLNLCDPLKKHKYISKFRRDARFKSVKDGNATVKTTKDYFSQDNKTKSRYDEMKETLSFKKLNIMGLREKGSKKLCSGLRKMKI